MNDILKLKAMGFTIDEIQGIKAKERLFVDLTGQHEKILNDILENKISAIHNEISELNTKIEMIKAYQTRDVDRPHPLSYGLPFEALDFLACPYCQESFNIESASIVNQRIEAGLLSCSCGDHFKVVKGIVYPTNEQTLIKPRSVEELSLNDKINNTHFAQLQVAGRYILDVMKTWNHTHGIIHINSDSDIFSMNLPSGFEKDGVYFFCSYESTSLEQLRAKMSLRNIEGKIIYICYGNVIPLKQNMPYFIDNAGYALDLVMNKVPSGISVFENVMSKQAECVAIHLHPTPDVLPTEPDSYLNHYIKLNFTPVSKHPLGLLKGIGQVFETSSLSDDLEMLGYHFKR